MATLSKSRIMGDRVEWKEMGWNELNKWLIKDMEYVSKTDGMSMSKMKMKMKIDMDMNRNCLGKGKGKVGK